MLSLMLDDAGPTVSRWEVRRNLAEYLNRPFGEAGKAYDAQLHANKNAELAEAQGMGAEDDPHMAQPVFREGDRPSPS